MSKLEVIKGFFEEVLVPELEQPYEVPDNWCWVRLGYGFAECLDRFRKPVSANERAKRPGNVPYYGATGQAGWIDGYLTDEELVLVGEDGAPFLDPFKNKAYMINGKSWVNNHAHILKSNFGETGNLYLLHYLNQFNYNGYVSGTTRLKLNQKSLNSIPIPLPPLAEQKRIADKVENLLSKIKEAKRLIEESKETFELRRAAILDKTFRGELTMKWREENQVSSTQKNLNGNNTNKDSIFPKSWVVTNFQSIAAEEKYSLAIGPFGSNLKVSDYKESGVPLIFVRHIRSSNYNLDSKYVSVEKANELKAHTVKAGDILITKMGDPPGDSDICPDNINKAIITADCIKLRVNHKLVNNKFIMYAIKSPFIQEQIRSQSKGVAQQKISLDIFKKINVPVPSIEEQVQIVKYIDNFIESEQNTLNNINGTLDWLAILEQSVLSKAFRGELGTNDPNEESALELLKEILSEKAGR